MNTTISAMFSPLASSQCVLAALPGDLARRLCHVSHTLLARNTAEHTHHSPTNSCTYKVVLNLKTVNKAIPIICFDSYRPKFPEINLKAGHFSCVVFIRLSLLNKQ